MDISFAHGREHVVSPEATLQALGRINRWGLLNHATYIISHFKNVHESGAINVAASHNIRKIWFQFLSDNIKDRQYTLDEIYEHFYNKFYSIHAANILSYLQKLYDDGMADISKIFPKKPKRENQFTDSDVNVSTINLRSPNASYFVTMYDVDKKTWTSGSDLTTCDNNQLERNFKNLSEYGSGIHVIFRQLVDLGYHKFAYYLKNRTSPSLQSWRKLARRSDAPMPLINYEYSKLLGKTNKN